MNAISKLRFLWCGKEEEPAATRERFVKGVIATHAFSRLTLQNKMLALAKLISVFRSDNGYTPRSLERALDALRQKCRRHTIVTWNTEYGNKTL